MNKAELIRHEIEKRRDHNLAIGNPLFAAMAEEDIELLCFIDSLQEEPKTKFKIGDKIRLKGTTVKGDTIIKIYTSEVGNTYFEFKNSDIASADLDWELVEEPKKCMFTKEEFTEEDRKILCEDCEEECEQAKKEEPVSVWHNASEKPERNDLLIETNNGRIIHRQSINNYGMVKRWAYTSDLLNLSNVQRTVKNWKEPVNDGLEEAAFDYAEACKYEGGDKLLCVEHFKAGAEWQKEQFEKNRLAHCDAQTEEEAEREWNFCMRILNYEHRQPTYDDAIKYGMRLKEKEMQSTIELAEDHAMLAGMEKMKEEMTANAIDVIVHIDAGGYPYIPQLELYDYDKDVPLAKEGDKYKVVLIKEDEL